MKSRQLQASIKTLCEEALKAEEREIEAVLQELRAGLRETNEMLRKLAAEYLLHRPPPGPNSPRRKRSGQ